MVIADFGLAGFCNGHHEFGGVGTDGALIATTVSSLPRFAGFRAPEVVDAVARTVACDIFSAGVFVAMLLRELVPSAFGGVDDVLGQEDLSADDLNWLQHSLEHDDVLPASAKEMLVATLDPSPTSRPSARRVLSYAFLDTELLPMTPVSSRKRAHPPSPPSSSASSPEQSGE